MKVTQQYLRQLIRESLEEQNMDEILGFGKKKPASTSQKSADLKAKLDQTAQSMLNTMQADPALKPLVAAGQKTASAIAGQNKVGVTSGLVLVATFMEIEKQGV